MKQNKYNEKVFFEKYSKMERSIKGLKGAGEWHILKKMFPDFKGKTVLDIGCGFGWHCRYASEEGAKYILGIDISEKMIATAKKNNCNDKIEYKCMAMEDMESINSKFDIVISSLAIHYIKDFNNICENIYNSIKNEGDFVFSVEHPIFTSNEIQDWYYNENKEIVHWPIDNYQSEGIRLTNFLGEDVIKYHRTVATYMNILIKNGFTITNVSEPVPSKDMIDNNNYLENELRRPMFLMISAKKVSKSI